METIKTDELDIIKKKSVLGIVALTSRTFILQIVAIGATFLLTIFLTPQIFGVFYVVSAIIAFLNYFSDVGLAAALIQKHEELIREDLTTTFTIQQFLVGIVSIISFLFSSRIAAFYGLDNSGLWLLRALIASFFLSSLKTIPSVLLERRLDFNKLIIPQILETLGFYIVAVVLAWKGWNIWSFSWAVIIRSVIGLIAMYIVSPWKISLGFSWSVARRLLRFGIPFQLNSFIALLKDDLMTVFLGKILPLSEVGYIGWAKKWADAPLRLIMDSVIRVSFPAFSRLQDSREHMTRGIEKTLFGMSLCVFPIAIGAIFFIHPLVQVIPKYLKWEPALTSFYLFAGAAMLASLTTPLTNALNAVGKIKITLGLMIMWTTLTWVISILAIRQIGFNGYALAIFAVSMTIGVVVKVTKSIAPFSFWRSVWSPIIAGIIQCTYYFFILPFVPGHITGLVMAGFSGAILYIGMMWLLDRNRLTSLIVKKDNI